MSILCSIIRLIPNMMRLRFYSYIVAVGFALMWAGLIILKITICETRDAWKKLGTAQCVLGEAVAAVELTSASRLHCARARPSRDRGR